jgi:hypothetical protein
VKHATLQRVIYKKILFFTETAVITENPIIIFILPRVRGVSVVTGMCLSNRCLAMNVVSEPFASNCYFSGSTVFFFEQIFHDIYVISLTMNIQIAFQNSMELTAHPVAALATGYTGKDTRTR